MRKLLGILGKNQKVNESVIAVICLLYNCKDFPKCYWEITTTEKALEYHTEVSLKKKLHTYFECGPNEQVLETLKEKIK